MPRRWCKPTTAFAALVMILAIFSLYGFYMQEHYLGVSSAGRVEIHVLCAGSLSKIVSELAEAFRAEHPYVEIRISAHGSLECARLVKAGARCDLILVSDYKVIEDELAESYAPRSMKRYCEWWAVFARNEIVLALAPGNPAGLNEKNWYWKLADPNQVKKWGRANPDSDPCGYRTLIVFNICDAYYPEHRDEFPGYPEMGIIKTLYLSNPSNVFVAAKEFDLMVALQTGQIDAGWTYLSLAEQFGLPYIRLPGNVSLGVPYSEFNEWYSRFTITTESGRTYRGSSISYAASIPTTAENSYWATVFLRFILTKGASIMERNSQPPVYPPILMGDTASTPPQIREVCMEG
ncbi:MAG: extracellular solute-binding protein [Candidatus Jordarchaeales archaeon]|nr:substrate-binding domain-containing protein [Candidatus Jordarchaeia archaeon]